MLCRTSQSSSSTATTMPASEPGRRGSACCSTAVRRRRYLEGEARAAFRHRGRAAPESSSGRQGGARSRGRGRGRSSGRVRRCRLGRTPRRRAAVRSRRCRCRCRRRRSASAGLPLPRRRSAIRTPPRGVYFSALPIRLRSTRSSSIGSPCARQPGRWRPTCRRRRKRFSCGVRSELLDQAMHQRHQFERLLSCRHRAGVHARDVEQRAEHRIHRIDRSAHAQRERLLLRGQLLGLERGEVEPERMQRLAQVVARGGEERRLRAVRRLGGVARVAHRLHRGDQLLALRRDAAFEVGVEDLELAGRDDEAVDQDPADQQQEQQAGVRRQVGRVVVVAEVGQPVAQRRTRPRRGRPPSAARCRRCACARRSAPPRRGRPTRSGPARSARRCRRCSTHAGRRGRVQHDRRQQRHAPQRAVEARPVPAGEADAEDHQHRDEERVQRGPPDARGGAARAAVVGSTVHAVCAAQASAATPK